MEISNQVLQIAENLKILVEAQKSGTVHGDILTNANHGSLVRLTTEEVKYIAKKTGLPGYKVYMAWGGG